MERKIQLALSRFPVTPNSLRETPANDSPRTEISVNLANLYHHYYLDSFERRPPDPDPAQFEHLRFLLPTDDFRLSGDGIGASTSVRRHRSNELGQAFCRWFLHDHLNITYFAHMEHVLDKSLTNAFGGQRIERIDSGDSPDYFCAESVTKIFLAEAKGRYDSISFSNQEFASWRNQFNRVAVKDRSGTPRPIKGFIVGTRFATETKPNVKSAIFAEDPTSPGEGELENEDYRALGNRIISSHYAPLALKLNQPILSAALENGFIVPNEILFPAIVWQFQAEPLRGTRFVGGYYPKEGPLPFREVEGGITINTQGSLRLDVGRGTFFGIEEKIFRQVVMIARRGLFMAAELRPFEQIQPFYSAISALRDGSLIAPIEFLLPVGSETY